MVYRIIVQNNPLRFTDPLGLRWYESPAVWADMIALGSDLIAVAFSPLFLPAFTMGAIASISSTGFTISEYQHGRAEWYDVVMSVGTTIIGLHPVLAIPADVLILVYDIWRAEAKNPCKT